MPLKGIPFILSPDLLYVLSAAGHGDEIVLADAHFPTSSVCRCGPREIRADGHSIPSLLEAVLKVFPLDTYVGFPVAVMEQVSSDKGEGLPEVWQTYQALIKSAVGTEITFEQVERFMFYERARKAFAVVHTGKTSKYGNIIIKKGLVLP